MRRTSSVQHNTWTPRTIFCFVLLGCIAVASASNSSYEIDSRFSSSQANLARKFHDIKGSFKHDPIPTDKDELKKTGDWAQDYGVGIAKIVGPGLAIAILTLLAGIIYGIFKIIRKCCCSKKRDPEDDSEEINHFFTWQKLVPTGIYAFCWVWLLAGMIIGLQGNPNFTDGVVDMSNYVVNVGQDAQTLGNGLKTQVLALADLIPTTLDNVEAQLSGIPQVSESVTELGVDVQSTADQVSAITAKVGAIDAGNTSAVANLNSQLNNIDSSSQQVISSVSDLTNEISTELSNTYTNTVTKLDTAKENVDNTMDEIIDNADEVITQANDLVNKVTKYTDDAQSYDKSRGKAVTALFSLVIVVTVLVSLGFVFKLAIIFNVVSGFGFVFLFFLWFSGSIHFLLGMVLNDACPVVQPIVQGLLPDGDAGAVLNGCLYLNRSVLDSLDVADEFNMTDLFSYKSSFSDFSNFTNTFNFSAIDDYFRQIQTLNQTNLRGVADNLTVTAYGWNETVIYTAIDGLNQLTTPDVYDETNYKDALNHPYADNDKVNETVIHITDLINLNTTIYNKTETAKQQLYSAQNDLDVLLQNYTVFQARYDTIKSDVNDLGTVNVANAIGYIDGLESNVTAFFALGQCSFLADTFDSIVNSLCGTMQPAIDLLTVGQFLAGIALIPMVVVAEVLSFRINKFTRIAPCGGADDVYDDGESGKKTRGGSSGKTDYAIALTDSTPATPPPPRHSITATIAASPDTPEILRHDFSGVADEGAVPSTDSQDDSNYE